MANDAAPVEVWRYEPQVLEWEEEEEHFQAVRDEVIERVHRRIAQDRETFYTAPEIPPEAVLGSKVETSSFYFRPRFLEFKTLQPSDPHVFYSDIRMWLSHVREGVAEPPAEQEVEAMSLKKIRQLETKTRLLESELRRDRPYQRVYRLGAGSFLVALTSVLFWGFTGIAAPFHPVFALIVLPVSIALIVMAFMIRRDDKAQEDKRN